MSSPIILAQQLFKHFGTFTAVDHIHFQILEGECFGFLGPNGAGKTSTMKMIYGFSPISGGSLEVFGQDVQKHATTIKQQIGVAPQENSLDPDLSVFQNLLVYASYFGIPRKIANTRAKELLHFFQLEEKQNDTIKHLSGGMQRRLVLARALINQPKILILDEPTTALDPQARHLIWNKLRALKKSGVTMVLTTHYMEEATQLCDRLVMMDHGKILAEGSPQELIETWVGKEVYELRAPTEALESLEQIAMRYEIDFERIEEQTYFFLREGQKTPHVLIEAFGNFDMHHRMASLEDVFLKIAGRELKE